MRQLINTHLFKGNSLKTMQIEFTKPVVVPAGMDSFSVIGAPYNTKTSDVQTWRKFVLDNWQRKIHRNL
jgi:hypothetical protein